MQLFFGHKIQGFVSNPGLVRNVIVWPPVFIVFLAYLSCFRNALIDDAFIGFNYVRTLRDFGEWGFYPGLTTHTASSPLNILLTAFTGLLVPDIKQAAIGLGALHLAVLCILLVRISNHLFGGPRFGILAGFALACNPLIMSTIGLETLLYVVLFTACVLTYLRRSYISLAICIAFLTLCRLDAFLLFLVFLVLLPTFAAAVGDSQAVINKRRAWVMRGGFCLLYFAVLLPWLLFAWSHLGSIVPDTLLIKKAQGAWGEWTFTNGPLLYGIFYPSAALVSFFFAFFIFLPVGKPNIRRLKRLLLVCAAIQYSAYGFLGVPPYHWYYAPILLFLTLAGALSICDRMPIHPGPQKRKFILISAALLMVPFGYMTAYLMKYGFYPGEAPIHTNWATEAMYTDVAQWLNGSMRTTARIRVDGEIGTLAWHAKSRLYDPFSTRLTTAQTVPFLKTDKGLLGYLSRINYANFKPETVMESYDYYLTVYPYGDRDPRTGQPIYLNYETDYRCNASEDTARQQIIREWPISSRWTRAVPGGKIILWQKNRGHK